MLFNIHGSFVLRERRRTHERPVCKREMGGRPPFVTAADATVSIMLVATVAPPVPPRRVFLITVSAFVRCSPELLRLFS